MQRYTILWADDEIDLLKPHILFLQQRGYDITPVNNGSEAVEQCEAKHFDVVFLDEHMPGMSGLEALTLIKNNKPGLPVVMITKNEEEQIMEEAIGAKIDDYLIKPLNPSQILLAVKKILDNKRLVIWELQMDQADNQDMAEVLEMQKVEANSNFCRFIRRNYESWLNDPKADKPMLSHQLIKRKVFPEIKEGRPTFLIVIDNLRFDQWKTIEPIVSEHYNVDSEETYYSILPTTTAYARNAIFSGMMPSEMAKMHPELWVGEEDDEGKNNFEDEFLSRHIRRNNLKIKFSYHKIKKLEEGRDLADTINNLFSNDLNVIVYNFVDMLSHARTDMAMIRELAPDEAAYRSITKSWFVHSPLLDILKEISRKNARVIITTDHGTIRVKRP